MKRKQGGSVARRPRGRVIAGALVALCFAGLLALVGCQPQQSSSAATDPTEGSDKTKTEMASTTANVGDFQNNDAGIFADTEFNTNYINAGNRGCNSCHEDLWDVMCDLSPIQHVLSSGPGYGQAYGVTDCLTCHHLPEATGGPRFMDIIHNAHYSNPAFTDAKNGNCFSCHAVNNDNEIVLWDYYKYTDELGGYSDSANPAMKRWLELRTWKEGTLTDVVLADSMKLDLELDQRVSDEENMFVADNYIVPELTADEYVLDVTGVVNPRSFTLADLQAMPQQELTLTQGCNTNAIGNVMIGNFPVKGVLLQDIIDACGGLKDNTPSIELIGYDEWSYTLSVDYLLQQGAMIGLQYWGHDLTIDQGYPATVVVPGEIGAPWVKWIHVIDFSDKQQDIIANGVWPFLEANFSEDVAQGDHCAAWITPNRDGKEFKVGEPIDVEGYAYEAANNGHGMTQVAFSADYGQNWTTFDVPENYDARQWVYWSGTWTPEKVGTYVLHVKAIDNKGHEQWRPDSIVVNVTE